LTSAGPSGGASTLRKIVAAIILVPLAVVIIAFAVANRQIVTVSLDPFSGGEPAAAVTLPLFVLIIVLLMLGVLVGGIAAWLGQGKWRRSARRLEREAGELRTQLRTLRHAAEPAGHPGDSTLPPRLQLKPPTA